MAIYYKKDILSELAAKGYTQTRLRNEKIFGQNTIQNIRHGKYISFDVLAKICDMLECEPGDIIGNRITMEDFL